MKRTRCVCGSALGARHFPTCCHPGIVLPAHIGDRTDGPPRETRPVDLLTRGHD